MLSLCNWSTLGRCETLCTLPCVREPSSGKERRRVGSNELVLGSCFYHTTCIRPMQPHSGISLPNLPSMCAKHRPYYHTHMVVWCMRSQLPAILGAEKCRTLLGLQRTVVLSRIIGTAKAFHIEPPSFLSKAK